jgi:hypothetical protein
MHFCNKLFHGRIISTYNLDLYISKILLEFYDEAQADLAVHSGAEIAFTSPPTKIKKNVCIVGRRHR